MKIILRNFLLVVFLIFCKLSFAQTKDSVLLFAYFKGNGDGLHYAFSNDGYNWTAMFNDSAVIKPTVSKDKLMRDPCIIKGADGIYHMVWTVSWNDKGLGYAYSKDLFHWSAQEFVPVMAKEDSARNTWAPEITYDSKKHQYIIYWATTISGRYKSFDTAAESKYNHRIYYVTTKDFKKYSKTKLLYEPGFSVIDASIIQDGKRYIMFLKNETKAPVEKNIRIAYANKITGPYSAAGPAITGKYWAEGPTAVRLGDKWIVYFDKYRDHKYGAVESSDLVNWKDVSDKIVFPKGVRHGTVLKISNNEFLNLLSNK